MNSRHWDAAVVGGGPAGLSAAIRLAQQGAAVILLEASRYPHDKVCGEFISPEGVDALQALQCEDPVRQHAVTIQKFIISSPGKAAWAGQLPGEAWSLSRGRLDDILQRQARQFGVTVCEGVRVSEINGDLTQGFQLSVVGSSPETICARAVVGAYGKRSRIDAALKRPFFDAHHPFMAVKAHFYGPSLADRIELHAFPGGYCGLSNIEAEKRNVCFLVDQRVFRAAGRRAAPPAEGFIPWMRAQNEHLDRWFSQAERIHEQWISIAQIPFGRKETVVNEILMAGDASGVIAPLAGDGISMALDSGLLAGELLARFLRGQISKQQLLKDYRRIWKSEFQQRLQVGKFLQQLLVRPGAANGMVQMLSAFPRLGDFFVARTRGNVRLRGIRQLIG